MQSLAAMQQLSMATEHPFQSLFETLGRLPAAHAEPVNRQAYEILYDILAVPVDRPGRCILLRAPRAGHGKTHLLSRIQHHLGSSHEFIPLKPTFGCQIDASTVIDDALRRLLRPLPASGGLCILDLIARRLFAASLQPLVASGEVPCQDREGALAALRNRPIETFDFHHPNAVTAHWARENFDVLGQRLSIELAQRGSLPIREVAFWVDTLFRFAATPADNPARLKALADAVHMGHPPDSVLMERLEALLGLLSQLSRVVLVADDLEGFSTDDSAALRLAAFIGALRHSAERIDVILSLNKDIWDSAFLPRLSGGLADRLSEVVVDLNPLTEEEMIALLDSRVPGLGARILANLDRQEAGTHARGLIRAAGLAWLRASAMDSQSSAHPTPAPTPTATPPARDLCVETPSETFPAPSQPSITDAPTEPTIDPTLAIAFLAKENPALVSPDWPEPGFPQTAEATAGQQDAVDPTFAAAPPSPEAAPPGPSPSAPVAAPSIPESEPAAVDAPPAVSLPPASTAAPVFEAAPEPVATPFQAAPPLHATATAASAPQSSPETDRVDDLLRQFRERYGR